MSTKRRDRKNRVLRTGEYQEKSGRYRFSYSEGGKRKSVYSWRLEHTDPLPPDRRRCVALRDMERKIEKDLEWRNPWAYSDITVLELVERYLATKRGVRDTTRAGYRTTVHFLENDPFGHRNINSIRISDAKLFLVQLQNNGKRYSSIHQIRGVLRPAFQMAVEDDALLKNPFEFQLKDVIINDQKTREAVSAEVEEKFLTYIKNDRHYSQYYEGMYILFNTGLRISEFCGLTVSDLDMVNRTIRVDHQLIRHNNMVPHIIPPKTKAGIRMIPMSDDVYRCFEKILVKKAKRKIEPIIDGRSGFLYLDRKRQPMVALHWEKYFEHSIARYNSTHTDKLPTITPHMCRHTYCTKMARSGMNPKSLQYLMGHSDISVTLNVYTHVKFEDAQSEVRRVATEA